MDKNGVGWAEISADTETKQNVEKEQQSAVTDGTVNIDSEWLTLSMG